MPRCDFHSYDYKWRCKYCVDNCRILRKIAKERKSELDKRHPSDTMGEWESMISEWRYNSRLLPVGRTTMKAIKTLCVIIGIAAAAVAGTIGERVYNGITSATSSTQLAVVDQTPQGNRIDWLLQRKKATRAEYDAVKLPEIENDKFVMEVENDGDLLISEIHEKGEYSYDKVRVQKEHVQAFVQWIVTSYGLKIKPPVSQIVTMEDGTHLKLDKPKLAVVPTRAADRSEYVTEKADLHRYKYAKEQPPWAFDPEGREYTSFHFNKGRWLPVYVKYVDDSKGHVQSLKEFCEGFLRKYPAKYGGGAKAELPEGTKHRFAPIAFDGTGRENLKPDWWKDHEWLPVYIEANNYHADQDTILGCFCRNFLKRRGYKVDYDYERERQKLDVKTETKIDPITRKTTARTIGGTHPAVSKLVNPGDEDYIHGTLRPDGRRSLKIHLVVPKGKLRDEVITRWCCDWLTSTHHEVLKPNDNVIDWCTDVLTHYGWSVKPQQGRGLALTRMRAGLIPVSLRPTPMEGYPIGEWTLTDAKKVREIKRAIGVLKKEREQAIEQAKRAVADAAAAEIMGPTLLPSKKEELIVATD